MGNVNCYNCVEENGCPGTSCARVDAARTDRPDPQSCTDDDGCPTELAVLQRFWREAQRRPSSATIRCRRCGRKTEVEFAYGDSGVGAVTAHGVTMPAAVWARISGGLPPDYTEDEFRAYSAIQLARERAAAGVQPTRGGEQQ